MKMCYRKINTTGLGVIGVAFLVAGTTSQHRVAGTLDYFSWAQPARAAESTPTTQPTAQASTLALFNTDNLKFPRDQIVSGGPPKDAIPALVEPEAVPASRARFLDPGDRVVGITVNGQARAYPIAVLNWHEVINDRLGGVLGSDGVPIAVVYCPLCDSVSVVDRRLDGKTYEFGVSGLLANSNVLMYDRTDQALWSQAGLAAISGPHAGRALRHLDNWELTTFKAWKASHPDSTVVTFNTGCDRNYHRNPYESYFESDGLAFEVSHRDRRFKNKTPVIGLNINDVTRAYPLHELAKAPGGHVVDTIGGQAVRFQIDPNRGSVRVIKAPDHAQVIHTYWFAWAAFHPETEVYEYRQSR